MNKRRLLFISKGKKNIRQQLWFPNHEKTRKSRGSGFKLGPPAGRTHRECSRTLLVKTPPKSHTHAKAHPGNTARETDASSKYTKNNQ